MKTKLPLEILEILHPSNTKLHLVTVETNANIILSLKPKGDELKHFYFNIVKKNSEQLSGHKTKYTIQHKPTDRSNTNSANRSGDIDFIKSHLDEWLNILIQYEKIETIFDDSILRKYQNDFEEKFKIVDEDAEYAPFNFESQLFLDECLDNIIEKANNEVTEENKADIQVIIKESNELKEDLTKIAKSQTIKRFAKIVGRVQKTGIKLVKEIVIKIVAEVSTKLILGNG